MKDPNFFIIGAPKCGTTSMAAWLAEHPEVFVSAVKELRFFCGDFNVGFISSQAEYDRWFKNAGQQHIAVGEASTAYLFSSEAVPRIEKKYPGAKYIVMLRNPVEMAYSLHGQLLFGGREHVQDFEKAWRLSPRRRRGEAVAHYCRDPLFLDYQFYCLLGRQMDRLFSIVARERVLVLLLDDIKADPRREYLKVLGFLGVSDDNRKIFPVKNTAKTRKYYELHKCMLIVERVSHFLKKKMGISAYRGTGILGKISGFNTRLRPRDPLSPELRREMCDYFKSDVEKLGSLVGRDLSGWLRDDQMSAAREKKGPACK